MSRTPGTLKTDKATVRNFILALSKVPGVESINIGGSRSPKSPESADEFSDWDIHVMYTGNVPTLLLPVDWEVYGEAHPFPSPRKLDVEVWPTDKYKLITE